MGLAGRRAIQEFKDKTVPALKSGLKKVVVANTKGNYSAAGFTFEGGTLSVDHEPCTNVDDIGERAKGLQELLERAL